MYPEQQTEAALLVKVPEFSVSLAHDFAISSLSIPHADTGELRIYAKPSRITVTFCLPTASEQLLLGNRKRVLRQASRPFWLIGGTDQMYIWITHSWKTPMSY